MTACWYSISYSKAASGPWLQLILLPSVQEAALPPQDPWLLAFYTAPALECGFSAWYSARLAQVLLLA